MATMDAPVAAQPSTAQTSAEEALQKKNTDCVYFLASPLTCKKGDECEFRHSEAARINPRDCWFWLSGTCLNRDCPFRHPPLDARAQAAQPVNSRGRTPTPCYYFAQGYCAKGDRCPFVHGVPLPVSAPVQPKATTVPDNEKEVAKAEINVPATKPVPVPKAVKKPPVDIQLHEEKPAPAQAQVVHVPKQVPLAAPVQNGTTKIVPEEASPEPLSSSQEDVHISDARAENGTRDPEDRWEESSPGFDVLVDDGPDQMHYGDEGEFHSNHDEAGGHFDDDMEPYEFQLYNQPGGYQAGSVYDHGNFDRYDRLGYDHDNYEPGDYERGSYDSAFDRPDYDRPRFEHPEHMEREVIYRRSREGPPNGRTHSIKERLGFNHRESRPFLDNNDLRNHLERRRRLEPYARGDRVNREFIDRDRQREEYDRERDRRMHVQYPQQGRANSRRSRERGSVEIGVRRFEHRPDVSETPGGFSHKSRGHIERRSARDASPTIYDARNFGQGLRRHEQSDFAAPKSLAQIRAEKRKFDGDEVQVNSKRGAAFREGRLGSSNHREHRELGEFEGPKPLREILKEKGKLVDSDRHHSSSIQPSDNNTNGSIINNNTNNFISSNTTANNNNHVLEEDSPIDIADTGDDLIDDEDDEDDFAKKLGGFFS